jgi:hypothetical protein
MVVGEFGSRVKKLKLTKLEPVADEEGKKGH